MVRVIRDFAYTLRTKYLKISRSFQNTKSLFLPKSTLIAPISVEIFHSSRVQQPTNSIIDFYHRFAGYFSQPTLQSINAQHCTLPNDSPNSPNIDQARNVCAARPEKRELRARLIYVSQCERFSACYLDGADGKEEGCR